MRTHTSEYKTSLQGVRETLSILTNITTNTEISESELNRIKPILNAELLKSTMRELNIESKIDIPLETELNLQFGVKTRYEEVEDERDNYDFIDYGNYIVYESEYQADTKLYIITCYDKMLYSMVDYETMEITYPITIRNYIKAIATHLGLEFANENDEFANYDKEIPNELYLDTNGRSLGYTFRDVLDELSQVTASNICINENDELEVRYINDNISSTATKTGTSINITDNKLSKILNLQLLGDTNQTGTPSPSSPVNIDTVTGQQNIVVTNGTDTKTYSINLGKNLLGLTNGDKTAGGITGTWNNGNFVYSGTASNTYASPTNNTNIKLPAGNYVFSISQALTIQCRLKLRYVDDTSQDITIAVGDLSTSFTTTKEIKWIYVWLNGLTVDTYYEGNINCMLEKGTMPTEYAPYFTPIELCKIGDYQDKIKKSTGKNLFNVELEQGAYSFSDGTSLITSNDYVRTKNKIKLQPNTTYTLSLNSTKSYTGTLLFYRENEAYIDKSSNFNNTFTFTTSNDTYYINIDFYKSGGITPSNISNIQLEVGTATEYEPYGKVWYIHKEIGKIILTGASSENWQLANNTDDYLYFSTGIIDDLVNINIADAFSNRFTKLPTYNTQQNGYIILSNNRHLRIRIDKTLLSDVSSVNNAINSFKTWLSSNNTNVYYVLETPTNTIITNETLINELEQASKLKLYDGTNNVIVDGDLGSVLSFNYATGIETIDENYLKNINVNFGEKYGPVNSIVLSRAGESDNVYLRDEQSVTEDGLCEIKISENQIMNFNDRSNYLSDILNQLDGLEYYLNDFSSTGITYLDVCDGYGVKIGDTTYNCIMFNDEINITQGLSEDVYTELPEETITDYKKADKTDRKINQAYIIVNKQNQEIEALTSRTEVVENNQELQYTELTNKFNNYATLENVETITNQVTQLQTDTYTKTQIQQIANGTGVDGVKVTAVISTEAQFDENGMHYSKTNAPTTSTINYKGLEVDDSNNNELLFAGYDEDDQSLTYGTSIVRSDNLNVKTYLQVGNNKGRFEQYTDDDGNTGVGFFLT